MPFHRCRRLALAHRGRFFIKLAATYFGQYARFFARAAESPNGDIKGFIFFNTDTRHID